ncbi:MAG: 30S ribosomal protein S8 [Saprospiraceae bacterium]|jgi:small subunit ribosomal protein S8|uniref:Small ribosomal subunit protein uS8 n=1 Tax=Candidatus Defluviibacterium haderslevense TaxID=2981993 RepID=A0A9D7XG64_9BACT|nr:30S ribosomal protein S8 [Candidatus Defluviibacterium haderslevense]MBP8034681.1 30S ribosomal protein S8 [Bacteroidia bacterium]MCC7026028.1 30S ribosomal protein S8 [Saprospiraceae bacterium]MBK7244753.1 30S ribosomal protein S8 [Candidatus Defluviibacterium haderslevense]MBK8244495.1 30S ribosomal protein S8 [Candidatus Defluviibacterium haderslevense]
MAVTDPIADYLTRIRNAQQAGHRVVDIPASNEKKTLTEILYKNGYILKYTFVETENKQGEIKIALKYDPISRLPVIRELIRVSKPGRRIYKGAEELPKIINGLGISLISTSKGIMTDKDARKQHIGGEVLCYVC